MDINRMFPFYREAKVIRRYKDRVNIGSAQYLCDNHYVIPEDKMEELKLKAGIQSKRVPLIKLLPNNVLCYCGNNEYLEVLMNANNRPQDVDAIVTELDYGRLAESLTIIDNGKKLPFFF